MRGVRRGPRQIWQFWVLVIDETYDDKGKLDGAFTIGATARFRACRHVRARQAHRRGCGPIAEPGGAPRAQHPQAPAAHAAQVGEVDAEVHRKCRAAGKLHAPDLADRLPASDHGECSLVQVLERGRGPGLAATDCPRHVMRLLNSGGRQARKRLAVGPRVRRHVADRRDLGMAGNRAVGTDLDPPARSVLAPVACARTSVRRGRREPRPPRSRSSKRSAPPSHPS